MAAVEHPAPPSQKTEAPKPNLASLAAIDHLERLRRMSTEDRARALSGLTPEQRERIESGIARLDRMSPERRALLLERYRRFQALDSVQKEAVREATRQLNQLPEPRRTAVRRELNRLRNMPEQQRQQRLGSAQFQNEFYPNERDIIDKESAILPESF